MQEARNLPNDATALTDLRTLTQGQLAETLKELGQPAFRAKQIQEWVWEKGASSFDDMTNLPKALRSQLSERFTLGGVSQVAKQVSEDGSRKYLLRYGDGTTVECVGMPSGSKLAVCVSSQAGCAMGCAFCATGAAGLCQSKLCHGGTVKSETILRKDLEDEGVRIGFYCKVLFEAGVP